MNTHLGRNVDQTPRVPNMATMPISRPQTVYTTSIMTTPTNKYVGWPPLI
jgi:hypothetical protein